MYQIARNAHVDSIQKRKFEVGLGEREFASANTMDENLKHKQNVALLRQAMPRLPLEAGELLVLSRFQNLKYAEIAPIPGCDVGAAKLAGYRTVRAHAEIVLQLSGANGS